MSDRKRYELADLLKKLDPEKQQRYAGKKWGDIVDKDDHHLVRITPLPNGGIAELDYNGEATAKLLKRKREDVCLDVVSKKSPRVGVRHRCCPCQDKHPTPDHPAHALTDEEYRKVHRPGFHLKRTKIL